MEVKKAIKKIIALAAGATMVGTTIMGAMAASLASYPAPFIKDGKFDGMLVVGDQAKAEDVIGATDIAMSLQYGMTTKKTVSTGGATTVVVEGDALKIAESTNKLEFGEVLNTIKTSVTGSDLKALAGGSITNEKGTYSYTETIDLPPAKVQYTVDSEDDTDTVADYLVLNQSAAYTYKMTFSPAIKTDVETTSPYVMNDLDNKDMTMLGKKYTFLSPKRTAITPAYTLTLMGGATKDIMEEGATKTFTINGKDFEVTVDWIGTSAATDKAKFTINGETTDSLAAGDTYKLSDGTQIGVTDVLQNEAGESAGGDKVEFNLGADKLEIKDTNTTVADWGTTCQVTVGSETLGNVACNIISSTDSGFTLATGGEIQISEIDLRYSPGQDLYVGKGKGASAIADEAEGEAGNFVTGAFDYKYEGLEVPKTEKISLAAAGNDNYKLSFTNKAGVKYDTEVFGISGANIALGKLSGTTWRQLATNENTSIADEDYFVVSKNKYSRILQFKDVNVADQIIKIKDVGSDVTNEVTYNALTGNLVLDGNTYKINIASNAATANITVDMDADGTVETNVTTAGLIDNNAQLWTELGAGINLTTTGANGKISVMSELKENSGGADVVLQYLYKTSDAKADINSTSNFGGDILSALRASTEDSDKYVAYTKYGIMVTQDRKSSTTSDQDSLDIVYPDSQVFGAAYITSGVTVATSGAAGTGEITTTEIVKIDVGASVLASEIAGEETKHNLILVGGPCANAAAAVIMGNPENCVAGFEAGKAKVKLYENSGKVAMLVAGATALDTRGAAQFVAQYDKNKATFAGATDEIALTVTSLSSITASIPTKTTTTTE